MQLFAGCYSKIIHFFSQNFCDGVQLFTFCRITGHGSRFNDSKKKDKYAKTTSK